MDFKAVYHHTNDTYCYPLNEDELIINIKTGYDIKEINIIHGDPYLSGLGSYDPWEGKALHITAKKRLKNHLWWTVTIRPPFKRLKYCFELKTETERWFLLEDGFLSEEQLKLKGRSRQYFIYSWMNAADIAATPKWVNETVWYQIFPERFCNGDKSNDRLGTKPWLAGQPVSNDEFYGGDLAGIISKLDYLKDLGISGLYLNPINQASTTHKYDTIDYRKIDSHFGSAEALTELVNEAHARGIRIMLDGVFNHSGPLFAPWLDVVEKGPASEYYDWFMVNDWPFDLSQSPTRNGQYFSFAFIDQMPKFNTSNPAVREYFITICEEWIRDYDIDGIRLDVADEISHLFGKELRQRLKALKPDFYVLGEIWHDSLTWLRGDEFDGVMNYPLTESIKDFWVDKTLGKDDFEYMINRCHTTYMQQINNTLYNLLDSHDTKRLRSNVNNLDEFFQQLCLLFAMPGSPGIYYGTEIAMEGANDPDCRRIMPWDEIEAGKYDEVIAAVRSLIKLRNTEPLLRNQNFEFPANIKNPRVIEFTKTGSPDYYIEVLVNCATEDVQVACEGEVLYQRLYNEETLKQGGVLVRRKAL
jgi:glycosidase